ncbi:hypothetical protein [Nocardioides sp.]|jgi:hypothetical protein|uniref:hypothetical protein n=1 Tax=Nocardioides sp. TaxID=35761 RepID=UPI002F3FA1FB
MGNPARAATLAAAALLTAGTLAGCGSDSSTVAQDPTPSSPTSPSTSQTSGQDPSGPVCATVWKKGATLPQHYRGCVIDAGWVKAVVYQCSDGHRLVTYAHAFYAAPGRTISRAATTLAKDHGFRQTMAVCEA